MMGTLASRTACMALGAHLVSLASTQTCAAPVARAPAKEMFDIADNLEEAV